jgi:hypothetical protein
MPVTPETDDPFNDPEYLQFVEDVRTGLIPKLADSSVAVSIVPGDLQADVKFAVELGFMVLMDKPIIAVMPAGTEIPKKLAAVSDRIVYREPGQSMEAVGEAISSIYREMFPQEEEQSDEGPAET